MIIKATFSDNDFTQVLEKFFNKPLFSGFSYCLNKYKIDNSSEVIRKYMDLSKEIDKYLKGLQDDIKFTTKVKQRFIDILKESILDFIKDRYSEDFDYLSKQLTITLQNNVSDHWENGETVYYFPTHDKYITM